MRIAIRLLLITATYFIFSGFAHGEGKALGKNKKSTSPTPVLIDAAGNIVGPIIQFREGLSEEPGITPPPARFVSAVVPYQVPNSESTVLMSFTTNGPEFSFNG